MSIDRTQPLQPINSVQPRDNNEAAASKARPSVSGSVTESGAQVSLSDAQAQLMQPGSQDINTDRVEQLKTAIRNGELKMDTGKIADALIQETKDYLQGK
ncbi:Flagellar biosynthesis anti-sigma factor FlgM [Paramixta manurensis]|uniref:Negative regulator of flagellin synthesis n=1 Tax=Paramixta manurensis TaxID=2740817 RepID=A0A6M8UB33_9GAMM|nr:Flagellar biosynthesis anti-sigma factor FlgM [Erwiniaceae bacterium PD-1]